MPENKTQIEIKKKVFEEDEHSSSSANLDIPTHDHQSTALLLNLNSGLEQISQ
jgi:hypothetical protein